MNFLQNVIEELKDENTYLATDGLSAGEFTGFIDTGSYILNAALSGSLYGGVPNNKITGFAGESATGKTYFVLGLVRAFLNKNKTGIVVYYDTEAAVTKEMMKQRGVDIARVIVAEPETLQKFKTHALKLLDVYSKQDHNERPLMLMVLDSLGMLPTEKEVADSLEGNDTRDMTKAQVVKSIFRTLTLKLAKERVPLLITNHTYDVVGSYVPTKEISGGSGFKFAASTIVTLGKKKEKDAENNVVGAVIKVRTYKSRLSKENQEVETLLTFDKGLDRYYGLLMLAEKHGIFKKLSKQWEMPDGSKVFEKAIVANPEKYYTIEVMERLEAAAKQEFSYGQGEKEDNTTNKNMYSPFIPVINAGGSSGI